MAEVSGKTFAKFQAWRRTPTAAELRKRLTQEKQTGAAIGRIATGNGHASPQGERRV